ncbi:hypothetical protein [Sphaerimonospora mesophila]|uniref:hypothetical protein n=1 Tax=Sphaerimonospora mesophila TaxID=37483 RepID=UPI00128F5852
MLIRRSRKHYLLIPVVLLAVLVVGCIAIINHYYSPVLVDDGVRKELTYDGKIRTFVEELSNTGDPLFEYEYVVLDRGAESAEAAIRGQVARMQRSGWRLDSDGPELWYLSSDRHQTVAYVRSLTRFLAEWRSDYGIYPEQRAANKIYEAVGDSASLIVITLRHFG